MEKQKRYAGILAALWLALAVYAWVCPRSETSLSERRKLAQFPAFSAREVVSGSFMEKFDSFATDQFPGRDFLRRIKAQFGSKILRELDNNGIYIAEGSAAKLNYPLNAESVENAIARFEKIYSQYLTSSSRIVICPVPDKGYYLAEKHGYPAMDYEVLMDSFRELPWATYADITGLLTAEDYYATDTHWKQERLLPVAGTIARTLGVELKETYSEEILREDFYGVYYGQAALPMRSDVLKVLTSPELQDCVVTNLETGETLGVYDRQKLWGNDPYEVFLSGPVSLLTIENPHAQSERELIVFRDSFGSSLVPLLAEGYKTITVVDIRYLPTASLGRFVDFHGQDVLFLYSTLVLNQSETLK